MTALRKIVTLLAVGFLCPLVLMRPAHATAFEVLVHTSPLSGDAVMAFDFDDSDTGSLHVLTISGFETDGALDVIGYAPPVVDCSSDVPFPFTVPACQYPGGTVTGALGVGSGDVSISDAGAPSTPITYYQMIGLGTVNPGPLATYIKFTFEMTGDPATDGATPDGFTFWLLDPSSEFGDPLGPGPLVLYTFGGGCDTGFSEDTARCTQVPSVPEPKSLALAAAALLALALTRRSATALQRRKAVRY